MTLKRDIRKVVKVGGSLGVTLPIEYVKNIKLKEGDFVEFYFDEQHDLICLKPVGIGELNKILRELLVQEQ
jgi:antitoxin component of MazEF toxin-antitoxin module